MSSRREPALPTDRELQLRIGIALVLLLVLPFAFVYTFQFAANTIGIALLEWASGEPYHGQFYVDPIGLAVVVFGGFGLLYWLGPAMVLSSFRHPPLGRSDAVEIEPVLTRLAGQANIPTPDLRIVDAAMPNAFAVGGPGNATVVVTTGLIDELDGEELEAVLAHEISHIRNRDASLMTIAWIIPTLTYYLAIAAYFILYGMVRVLGSGTRGGGNRDGRALLVAIVVITVSALVTIAISVVFWLGSVALYRTLSQYREYAADRGAAALAGSPAALASALQTIDDELPNVPDRDLRQFDGGTEALYLAPLETNAFEDKELISTDIFPSSHPPTEERIDRLRDLAAADP